ncbi:hypothetical protein ACFLY0_01345 [Patescibacteria group bacterium]
MLHLKASGIFGLWDQYGFVFCAETKIAPLYEDIGLPIFFHHDVFLCVHPDFYYAIPAGHQMHYLQANIQTYSFGCVLVFFDFLYTKPLTKIQGLRKVNHTKELVVKYP